MPSIESHDFIGVPARIVVMGTTGSGKTTVGRRIAAIIGAKHVELDGLFHGPDWTPAEPEVFRSRVADATACERWVTDGNYRTHLADLLWPRADLIVWLDYPFRITFTRLFKRTMRRWLRREELWNGNRESLWDHFFKSDSLFLWAVKTHWKHRREYPSRFACYPGTRVIRLRTPAATERCLTGLEAAARRAHEASAEGRA